MVKLHRYCYRWQHGMWNAKQMKNREKRKEENTHQNNFWNNREIRGVLNAKQLKNDDAKQKTIKTYRLRYQKFCVTRNVFLCFVFVHFNWNFSSLYLFGFKLIIIYWFNIQITINCFIVIYVLNTVFSFLFVFFSSNVCIDFIGSSSKIFAKCEKKTKTRK